VGGIRVWTQGFVLAKQVHYPLSISPIHFSLVILEMGVSWTICPIWPQTLILPMSASQVARITGVNHQCLAISF
jgi:hypothetical protein